MVRKLKVTINLGEREYDVSKIYELNSFKALFSSPKILQNFSDSPSHRIFRRMHEVLNIDKNKN